MKLAKLNLMPKRLTFIATLLTANFLHAQTIDYKNSQIHKDLSNIANKIDDNTNAAKSLMAATAVVNGLKALGDVIQNEKFRTAAESIFRDGDWSIYQGNTGLGTLTVVYGSGRFAVLINGTSGPLVGNYEETRQGAVQKGRMTIDINSKTFKTNPIFGEGENSTLRLVDSSDNQK